MVDLYLRFNNQQEMLTVLQPLGMTYTDEEGVEQVSQGNHQYALWQVGTIPQYTGWHVNIRQIDMEMDLSPLTLPT